MRAAHYRDYGPRLGMRHHTIPGYTCMYQGLSTVNNLCVYTYTCTYSLPAV